MVAPRGRGSQKKKAALDARSRLGCVLLFFLVLRCLGRILHDVHLLARLLLLGSRGVILLDT